MNGLPTVLWVWTVCVIAAAGALFCGMLLVTRGLRMTRSDRRLAVISIWFFVVTVGCWLLFKRADAEAATIHRQNVGISIVYLYFWLLAVVPAPLVGFGITRLLVPNPR